MQVSNNCATEKSGCSQLHQHEEQQPNNSSTCQVLSSSASAEGDVLNADAKQIQEVNGDDIDCSANEVADPRTEKARGPNGWKHKDAASDIVPNDDVLKESQKMEEKDGSDQAVDIDVPEPANCEEEEEEKKEQQRIEAVSVTPGFQTISEHSSISAAAHSDVIAAAGAASSKSAAVGTATATTSQTTPSASVETPSNLLNTTNSKTKISGSGVSVASSGSSKSKRRSRRRRRKNQRIAEAKFLAEHGYLPMNSSFGGFHQPVINGGGGGHMGGPQAPPLPFFPTPPPVQYDGKGNYYVQTPQNGVQQIYSTPAAVPPPMTTPIAAALRSEGPASSSAAVPTQPRNTHQNSSHHPSTQVITTLMSRLESTMNDLRLELALERQERKRVAAEHTHLLNALIQARNLDDFKKTKAAAVSSGFKHGGTTTDSETGSVDSQRSSKADIAAPRFRPRTQKANPTKGFVTPLSSRPGSPSASVAEEESETPSEPLNTKSNQTIPTAATTLQEDHQIGGGGRQDMDTMSSQGVWSSDNQSVQSGYSSSVASGNYVVADNQATSPYNSKNETPSYNVQYFNPTNADFQLVASQQMQLQQMQMQMQAQAQIQAQAHMQARAQMQAQVHAQLQQQIHIQQIQPGTQVPQNYYIVPTGLQTTPSVNVSSKNINNI